MSSSFWSLYPHKISKMSVVMILLNFRRKQKSIVLWRYLVKILRNGEICRVATKISNSNSIQLDPERNCLIYIPIIIIQTNASYFEMRAINSFYLLLDSGSLSRDSFNEPSITQAHVNYFESSFGFLDD